MQVHLAVLCRLHVNDSSLFVFLQLLEGNFALFITYALGHRNDFQNILLVIMVSVYIFHWGGILFVVESKVPSVWQGGVQPVFWGLSSREETHANGGGGAERADFQGERRCCLGSWEPVSQPHTHMASAGDGGRDRHTVELLLPSRSFSATMGTATIGCALLSILLSALLHFPLFRSGNIFGRHVS